MSTPTADDLADRIGQLAQAADIEVAVAESLTGGAISSRLAAAPDSSTWYAGGVVAYETHVKYEVLGVPDGHPVVTEEAAAAMAAGVADLMRADAAVAVTGAGGPEPQEGQPPGTTWIAVCLRGEVTTELHHFSGEPADIVEKTELHALRSLHDRLPQKEEHT
ncbi:competence-damage inducible protein [Corynebacterium maris DSM 45190]|uniref:Competence-damage inducible protein n=1 Tax=Corynebacterium maris DSM 45190 TaxID=1224163 RepID=S5TII2_9CORY|nr:CinA family protein [Corynebacterium maris]AGS34503.1 competence-damage inducible protein [Corynebacterium maris DSM 45190]